MKRTLKYITVFLALAATQSCDYLKDMFLPDTPEDKISIDIDDSAIVFSEGETTRTVSFTVTENGGDAYNVSVRGLRSVSASVDKRPSDGTITFTADAAGAFSETANIVFTSGNASCEFTIKLSRPDGSPDNPGGNAGTKSFSFPEYARMFKIDTPDKFAFSVSGDCADWVAAKVGTIDGGSSKNGLFILLKENTGNKARQGTVTITDNNGAKTDISFSQLGAEMDGSFKKALLDFYNALDGKNWFKRAGDDDDRELHWNKDMQILDFYGLFPSQTAKASSVDPAQSGNVYYGTEDEWQIGMPFNGLRGTIPESFWNVCKYFTYIKINNCYLQNSTLSDKVWHEKLVGINFEHTYIGGEITQAVANAKNLQLINFRLCHLTGEFPSTITQLSELVKIDFDSCALSGSFPKNLGDLSKLQELNLGGNLNFGGTLPDSFYNLSSLVSFFASLSQLGGTLSPRIGEMKNLKYFYIDGCEFEGKIPEELGTLTRFIFAGENNYFTEVPEFVRYSGCEDRWILLGGTFPDGVPSYQRKKETGRPNDMYVFDKNHLDVMTVNESIQKTPYTFNTAKYTYHLPLPIWAHIRYNIVGWTKFAAGTKVNKPEWPYADDLQYPANEYYYDKDRKAWCHPKIEYPAREYYKDSKGNWVHDASCPWDKPYVYEE